MKILGIIALLVSQSAFALDALPSADVRQKMIQKLTAEITRLDGEGLYVRQNRPRSWNAITTQIQQEATAASDWKSFYRSFARLNQAFPNLHSNLTASAELASALNQTLIRPKADFTAEWLTPNLVRFVISKVDSDLNLPADIQPQAGDLLIAINGRDMKSWALENFEFCKFPLKEQCDFMLPEYFKKEILSWERSQDLNFTLQRNDKVWTIAIPVKEVSRQPQDPKSAYCKYSPNRYDDFHLIYSGNRLCIYESPNHPKTAVMRITSFNYPQDAMEPGEKILSIDDELETIYPWWNQHATWDHLVIDVIDNHGGNAPIPYYQILLQHDFQEQYVIFKKTKEMNDATLRKGMFWGSRAQEIWFQDLVSTGAWNRLNIGEYTSPVPMFCTDEHRNCAIGKFSPRKHPFNGDVRVLVNQWCVSSCDGFVNEAKEQLGAKAQFFGHPQAADTAYSRLTLQLILDRSSPDGFRIDVAPLSVQAKENLLLSQTVVVTQSVTEHGYIVSGKPVPLTKFIPFHWNDTNRWVNLVLQSALP
jgi:hypothetical protein